MRHTHGILLNQILAYDCGKFSGREGNPGSSELQLCAPELWSFTFLNSSISSPQITSTVIRPRPLSPSRSYSRAFSNGISPTWWERAKKETEKV